MWLDEGGEDMLLCSMIKENIHFVVLLIMCRIDYELR